jgi:hypothetical protein
MSALPLAMSAALWPLTRVVDRAWRDLDAVIARIEPGSAVASLDLAEIPAKAGVSNVYADVGQLFAQTTIAEPRLSAAMMGQLIAGLGADHVCWGTDAIWTGAPQWQIEALRRLEIPDDMQRRHGFAPLGAADGAVKRAIFGGNNARLYRFDPTQRAALDDDRLAVAKRAYEREGGMRTNLAYGFVSGRAERARPTSSSDTCTPSAWLTREIAMPLRPARPVRPIRCT